MTAALLFFYGAMCVLFSVNALRPPPRPGRKLAPIWLFAVLTGEAPWLWMLVRPLIAGALIAAGALDRRAGVFGALMVALSLPPLFVLAARGSRSARQVAAELAPAKWWEQLTTWPYRIPRGTERIEAIQYAPGLTLDLYRPKVGATGKTLIYLHGGSWGSGDPRRQFRPISHYLTTKGWSVLAIRYPLSPRATFPDHLVGAVQVFGWIERQGVEWGLDPERVAVAGGSAGAHLAALAALSPGAPVRAAVCLYGVYDFLNRFRHRFDWPVIPRNVMKATAAAAPEAYRAASPLDQAHAQAPPFLLVHGGSDSLVPVAESQVFAHSLEEAGAQVELLVVKEAQHAFDILNGPRTRALAVRIERFLARAV